MKTANALGQKLAGSDQLDLVKTFECGQCFRWKQDETGVYSGVADGKILHIWKDNSDIFCDSPDTDMPFWLSYFDLEADYRSADALFTQPEHLQKCAQYGVGIRILRQQPWEALCSFIISQCNNIPRIKKIISVLCCAFGNDLGGGMFSFPDAALISTLTEKELAPLRCGYRAAYILSAARAVTDGTLSFDGLLEMPADEARVQIKKINGVGDKVANCFMLYGLHRMDSFPIDVWMKRALKQHFPADFDPSVLGPWAGLAQQYIFFYERENNNK